MVPTGVRTPDSTTQFNNFYSPHFVQQTPHQDVSNDSSRYEQGTFFMSSKLSYDQIFLVKGDMTLI